MGEVTVEVAVSLAGGSSKKSHVSGALQERKNGKYNKREGRRKSDLHDPLGSNVFVAWVSSSVSSPKKLLEMDTRLKEINFCARQNKGEYL